MCPGKSWSVIASHAQVRNMAWWVTQSLCMLGSVIDELAIASPLWCACMCSGDRPVPRPGVRPASRAAGCRYVDATGATLSLGRDPETQPGALYWRPWRLGVLTSSYLVGGSEAAPRRGSVQAGSFNPLPSLKSLDREGITMSAKPIPFVTAERIYQSGWRLPDTRYQMQRCSYQ